MRINMGSSTLELSYVDLLVALQKDISSDECMPDEVKEQVIGKIDELEALLWSYSA